MLGCMRNAAQDSETERIKVSYLEIIVTMIGKKPYYEIKYKKIREDYYHVGYSSYKLENVLTWRDECFDLVREPQTNADRIRSMTNEELVSVVMCPDSVTGEGTDCNQYHDCKECTLDWLQKESEV